MNKREKENSNRFAYDSDLGLSVVKEESKKEEVKKSEDENLNKIQRWL